MFEVIKKHFLVKKTKKKAHRIHLDIDEFGENVSNGYVMAILSGNYSVNSL